VADADGLRAELAALRERAAAQQLQLQLRERMLDDLSSAAGAADEAVTWRARAELAQAESAQLRAKLGEQREQHAPALAAARADADAAAARADALARELDGVRANGAAVEGQISRLSTALQLHVAEADELSAKLADARLQLRGSVDRQVARSWVVNFVENYAPGSAAGHELLEMMAGWWEMTAEDRIRVGLAETTDALHTPNETIAERWVKFLNRGAEDAIGFAEPGAKLADSSASRRISAA
jgi:hypothetical protein